MFHIEYNEVLSILASMSRTLGEIDGVIDTFAMATAAYNATMQDATATEATLIVNALREEIERMKELISKSNDKLHEGAAGLKRIEDDVSDGGLKE